MTVKSRVRKPEIAVELEFSLSQITASDRAQSKRTHSDLTQQVEALKNYKSELHEEMVPKIRGTS